MKISMQNFLAIQDKVEIELNKINLFIGANNCGKSTLGKLHELLIHNNHWRFNDINTDFTKNNLPTLIPDFSIWSLNKYHSIDNIINDRASDQSIDISFSDTIDDIKYDFYVKLERDEYAAAEGADNEQKSATIKKFLFTANNTSVILYEDLKAHINFGAIKRILFSDDCKRLKAIPYFSYSESNKSQIVEEFVILGDEPIIIEGLLPTIASLELRDNLIKIYPKCQGANLISTLFVNELYARLLGPFTKLKKIDQDTHTSLDWGSLYFANRYLKKFGLECNEFIIKASLIKKPNDNTKKNELTVGKQWLIKQNNEYRMPDTFGSGTATLLRYIKKIAADLDEEALRKDYTSENDDEIVPNEIVLVIEPERDLHPDWQIELTKVIIDRFKKRTLIIETHSLLIFRALQLEIAKGNIRSEDVTIHEFYREPKTDVVRIDKIQFDQKGFMLGYFKKGFDSALNDIEKELWLIQQNRINEN
jgi:predicted ATP-dependent endonuclease of OLD family